MTDLTDVYAALKKADAAGDTAGAKQLADYIRSQSAPKYGSGKSYDVLADGSQVPTGSPAASEAQSPVSDSSFQNFAAGYGKAGVDLARGAGQALGMVSRQDVANSRALDAPLMQTGAGRAGNIAGTVADLAPTAFIPGANTMAGAAAIGVGTGLLQPSTGTGETLTNAGLGGVAGPAGLLAGRTLGAGYNAAKGLVQPLFANGQDAIAARALQSFAGGPQDAAAAASALANPPAVLPGVQPTTAELTNNAGLSQFERQLRNNPDLMTQMTARDQANRAAMVKGLSDIGGDAASLQAAKDARTAISKPLYDQAGNASVAADATLNRLLQRPSMQGAVSRAETLAAERGEGFMPDGSRPLNTTRGPASSVQMDPLTLNPLAPPKTAFDPFGSLGNAEESAPEMARSLFPGKAGKATGVSLDPLTLTPIQQVMDGKNIQYLKMALNDMANSGPQMGMGSHEVGAVKSTLGSLNDWTTANVPELRAADAAYADASKPINQMEVGQALSNKLLPALSDFGGNARLNSNAYAGAVRNGDALAADVTGNKLATMAKTMTPDQMQTIQQIGEQLARRSNAQDLGRATGSNTSQNIISQNMLRQVLGPLGLPESMTEKAAQSTFGQTLMFAPQFAGKLGEKKILGKLADAALNPTEAARLLQMNIDPSFAKMIWARQGILGSAGTSAALLGNSPQ